METKKVLGIIFSLLFVGAFAFVLSWGIINFNKVKDGMSGTGVYTKEDINKSYEDGYNTALTDKEEYTKLIASYRDTITTLNDNISQLNSQVTILQNNNKDYSNQIDKLNTQKSSLETQVDNLTTIQLNNEITIASLNSQITDLQKQVTNLTTSGEDKSEQIATLNSQIATLQNTVLQLQTTNDMNVATITSLNTQITNLNIQISDMTLQSQNSQSQINALNNKINELQASVNYYESYIAQLENGEQVVATFEFDGSVYNIQIVNKGSKLSVITPTSTTYKIFNGWTVNGSIIDLSTFTITTNTKIVADVTYKYDVKFKVDDNVVDSQIITKNNCATLPTNPTKDGYEFDGWSLNGVDVISDISTRQVTQNVTYTAVFTKLHTVTFVNGEENSTIKVRNGAIVTEVPSITSTLTKIFNGWKVGNNFVDFNIYKIYSDTTFIADYTVKTFNTMTWQEISNISNNGLASSYFNLGDEKDVTLSNGTTITVLIIGFNHDSLAGGSGKAGITLGIKYLYDLGKENYDAFSTRAYHLGKMNTELLPELMNLMPDELKSSIKNVSKNFYWDNEVQSFETKLFLFSTRELTGKFNNNSVDTGSEQYDYYKNHSSWLTKSNGEELNVNYVSRDTLGGFYCEIGSVGLDLDEYYTTQYINFGFCI